MQHLQGFQYILRHILELWPGKSLLPRCPCHVVIKILQNYSRGLHWILDLIQQGSQVRAATLKAIENVTLIVEAPMAFNTLHDNGFLC